MSDDDEFGWADLVSKTDWHDRDQLLQYSYDFYPLDNFLTDVLVVRTLVDMLDSATQFSEMLPRECVNDGETEFGTHIKWAGVKAKYKGLLITPYQPAFSHRKGDHTHHWYRFDCASGCFWDWPAVLRQRSTIERTQG